MLVRRRVINNFASVNFWRTFCYSLKVEPGDARNDRFKAKLKVLNDDVEHYDAVASLLFLLCCLLQPAASRADSPTEQVRATVDKVLTIVRSPKPKSKAQLKAQRR